MKKILIFIFLFFLSFSVSFANSCKYQGKIDKCNSAIKNFSGGKDLKNIGVGGRIKEFSDFPCIQDSAEARIFQIATDENFKEIDKEMDKYLKDLFTQKDFYFKEDSEFSYFEAIEHIFLKKDEFKERYDEACRKSFEETFVCTNNPSYEKKTNSVSILGAINFMNGASASGTCYKLGELKSSIFLEVAYNGILLNKQQFSRDILKKDTQIRTENYGKLLEAMRINQAYIERLNSKWTSKTKHTLNSR